LYFIKPRGHLYDCYYYPFVGMDEEALRGLNPVSDPQLQRRALQYFEQLKSLESGWKLCAEAFVNGSYHGNDHVKFFCLQVIENYLKTGYSQANLDDHQNIKSFIARCLQLQGSEGTQDRSFIRNKIGQIISLAFVQDYPHRWPSFFTDLLQTVSPNHHSIDIYLRVLLAIDSDVVDREIVHTAEEFQRNTLIKDAMREQANGQLAGTWYEILTTYETSNPEVVCMCLDVIGKFISWIDINLIANDKFVTVLLNFMTLTLIRESACDCITDILNKGMDPIVKTKLVESFTNVLEERGILSPVEDEEGDFLAKLSKLVNAIGVNLILAWQKLLKTEDKENTEATLQALESKVPLMFRFLSDEDDDVSGAVAQFSQEYIALLKQMKPLSQKQRENMEVGFF
ncbi:exportin-t x1 isoform, partial [Mytilus galloprovincialis]